MIGLSRALAGSPASHQAERILPTSGRHSPKAVAWPSTACHPLAPCPHIHTHSLKKLKLNGFISIPEESISRPCLLWCFLPQSRTPPFTPVTQDRRTGFISCLPPPYPIACRHQSRLFTATFIFLKSIYFSLSLTATSSSVHFHHLSCLLYSLPNGLPTSTLTPSQSIFTQLKIFIFYCNVADIQYCISFSCIM